MKNKKGKREVGIEPRFTIKSYWIVLQSFPEDESKTPSMVLGSTKNRSDKPHAMVYFHEGKIIFGGDSYRDDVFFLHFSIETMTVVLGLLKSGQELEVYHKQ